jgi:uncharacterized membrane protein
LILLPLSLLYGLGGDVRVLLGVQTLVLAAGALPLYRLHRDLRGESRRDPRTTGRANLEALLLAAAYLVYLPLHYVQMADFHPSALVVPLLIAAWRAMRLGRWRAYYVWLLLAFSCRVDAAFCALGLGLVLVLWRPKPLFSSGSPKQAWWASSGFHGLLTLVAAAVWLALDLYVVVPLVRGLYGSGAGDLVLRRFGALGNSPLDIARSVISRPLWVLSLLAQRDKLQALFDLLAPAGVLSLLGPWALAPALPVLLINLLAGSTWQQSVHAHYMAPVIPFIWVAAAEGIAAVQRVAVAQRTAGRTRNATGRRDRIGCRLARWLRWAFQGTHLAAFALLCSLLTAVVLSSYPPGIRFQLANYWPGRGSASSYRQAQRAVVAAVPDEASVCAQIDLYPHLARRREASLFPYCRLEGDRTAEYVLLDLDASSVKSPLDYHAFYKTVTAWLSRPDYGVVQQKGGVLLLQQGASREALPQVLANLDVYGREFYRVTYVQVAVPAEMDRSDLYRVPVTLRNVGSQTWHSRGQLPVRLSYRWWTESGALLLEDSLRTDLPHRVEPGHEIRLRARIHTPREPGHYILEWDLVREGDAWFGDMGAAMLRQMVTIR